MPHMSYLDDDEPNEEYCGARLASDGACQNDDHDDSDGED